METETVSNALILFGVPVVSLIIFMVMLLPIVCGLREDEDSDG